MALIANPRRRPEGTKDEDIPFVDLRFTDAANGSTSPCALISSKMTLCRRHMFDGSSIAGWKAINESDMALIPDASTAVMDPFAAQPSMIMFCDIMEPKLVSPTVATRARLQRKRRPIWACWYRRHGLLWF